jgi:hypothetical protein
MLLPQRRQEPQRATPGEFLAFLVAYLELIEARYAATDAHLPAHARPVSRKHLNGRGIGDEILFWMMYQAQIEHLRPLQSSPSLQPVNSLHLDEASAFALTDAGEAFADSFLVSVLVPRDPSERLEAWERLLEGTLLPHYDFESRVFSWGRHILKCFRQPSKNQELLLSAAEELRWPDWFDDPLAFVRDKNPKILLHDTIKDLNRRQSPYLIHFKGDGTGRRIGWEYR